MSTPYSGDRPEDVTVDKPDRFYVRQVYMVFDNHKDEWVDWHETAHGALEDAAVRNRAA